MTSLFTNPILPHSFITEEKTSKPKVLIAGAGLGGLTLAILLKKAGVPFKIFERSHEIKPLGIYEKLLAIAKPVNHVHVITDGMQPVYTMNLSDLIEASTYPTFIVARPDLYDLLWSEVPRENIHLGMSVHNFDQDKKNVLVRCTDASKHYCDILVGADGAYSRVRETLYKSFEHKGKLPASDNAPLPFKCICLVGQTDVLDPEEFPDLKGEFCKDYSVVGTNNMYTWCTFTTKKNTLCWMVIEFLDKEMTKEDESYKSLEWGPQAAEVMCNLVRGFKIPGSKSGKVHTLGDLIDRTPKDLIAKVMLEEKLFSTWNGGRVVLLGDACHKLVPSSGQGGASAMHDAVALANWIAILQSASMVEVEAAFQEYHAERYAIAKEEYDASQGFTNILGKDYRAVITRAVLGWLPTSVWNRIVFQMARSRPQASFLPLVEEKGTLELAPQPSLTKTLPILKKQAEEKQRRTHAAAI
ncbi:hypothetical protein BG003_003029 [Podila horticola]|nr:hypothetical protein BG003_003029 [Podila horticola]